ncbi:MAG: M23 family metallopeptidase [Lachnospiraceae bacterium]|nr:M23 family metallopeptidase [Lachnospiraceae bacterium]MDD7629022.1 peptidoglycan DD-metalloendopeptidase family protein [Lachnospiraceae bacterium]MDY4117696.1 peptidoglycan DD-metalloendopeptidase family protein [Lachnospiraceae bacterium]
MKRKVKRRGYLKERIVMAACAVTVLSALTAAGLWMREDDKGEDQGYVVDLSEIENSTASGGAAEGEVKIAQNVTEDAVTSDDLDYDPYFQETNSAHVENPDQSESESMSEGTEEKEKKTDASEKEETVSIAETEDDTPAISTAMQPTLSFSDNDSLVWPVVGNILINYSMDKTIYFPTLDQYKYNPAIVIQANEGDMITAAAAGKVTSVFTDPQIGNAVTMDLGNGYEITYGQLTGILVSEGSYVSMGDMIAQVAAPTKYYSVEGTNVYFKLTKDGEPVNPMTRLS